MRHATLMRRAGSLLAATGLAGWVLTSGRALAQEPPQITPNFSITPSKVVTPWIYQMAIGAIILGALVLIGVLASYLRFSPKFFGREEAPARTPPGTRPPLVRQSPQARPRVATHAPAAATAPATAPAATATAVMEAHDEEQKPEPEPTPAPAPAAAEPPPAAAPAPAAHAESALDQETFDRVLQEQLDKGMDRRVAQGRARAAAVVAARKKAQG